MTPLHRARRRLTVGLLLAALPACRLTAPLALPAASPVASWHTDATASELAPRGLVATLFAVAQPPAGAPVALAASVISSDRGAPFRGRSRLPIGSLWLDDAAARTALSELQNAPGDRAQLLGDTTMFVAADLYTSLQTPLAALPQLQLRLRGHGVEVQLVTPLVPPAEPPADVPAAGAAPALAPDAAGHEHLTIAARLGEADAAALYVPAAEVPGGGFLLALLPGPPPAAEHVAARREAANRPATAGEAAAAPAAWQVAMQAIGEHNRRPALLALLSPHELHRAADSVLAADERGLIAITGALGAMPPEQRAAPWPLERAVWNGLLPRIERDDLTPAMRASLLRQLGALADDPATLSLLLGASADCTAFAAALREENVVALDDRSAAARTIAADWLHGIAVEVPGYDPLADKSARRDALHAWRNAQAAAAEEAHR